MHAIATLVSDHLATVPSFLWLFIVWADLRLTAVSSRAPSLPYTLHSDFDVGLPLGVQVRSKALATWNATTLPRSSTFSTELAVELLERLYQYTAAYNEGSTDWVAAWNMSYRTAFLLAQLQEQLSETCTSRRRCSHNGACAVLLAARIQFWGTMSPFVPQRGLQRYLLLELTNRISHLPPKKLCNQWARHAGLESLLWILSNAIASAMQQYVTRRPTLEPTLCWLRASMTLVAKRLDVKSYNEFEQYLRRWPFAENWNGALCRPLYVWLEGGDLVTKLDNQSSNVDFGDFRLTFDPMEERSSGEDSHHSCEDNAQF